MPLPRNNQSMSEKTTEASKVPEDSESSRPMKEMPAPVNWTVFIGAAIGILAIALWGILAPRNAENVLNTVVGWISDAFGWFYILLALIVLIFVIYLALSRFGDVKLGPSHSEPQFGGFTWASMLFAAGIGTDLMFFAVAEPVTQYLHPPSGEAETVDAAREATVWTLFHYGVSGWGMYALMGMALAYFAYRMNLPLAVRSALRPIFGKKTEGRLGDSVDLAAVLGTVFGVATSLGIGVVLINVGLNVLFDVPRSIGVQIVIVVLGVATATLSAVSGVAKGIRRLSELNVLLAVVLALWILITGKTQYLLEGLVLNLGDFVRLFPDMMLQTFAFEDTGTWMSDWTLFFWAWWIAWASFVGLFLARMSRGRTIRQFVGGTLIIPLVYILMWISIYGNAALDLIRGGNREFGENTVLDPEGGFFRLLQEYPAFTFVAGLAIVTALLFYVTSADSAALVMANLTSKLPTPQHDGRPALRIFWAATTGLLTIAMLLVGGIGALQSATVIMGLPFAFAMILVMIGLYRALRVESYQTEVENETMALALSGRAERVDARTSSVQWKRRLSRALSFPDVAAANRYEQETLLPTLHEVADEMSKKGVDTAVVSLTDEEGEAGEDYIELIAQDDGDQPFRYQVWRRRAPMPTFGGGRAVSGHEEYVRLEVYLGASGRGYDIMGYTYAQIVDDVLDQYERHLEVLRRQGKAAGDN